jgi:PilZ domain
MTQIPEPPQRASKRVRVLSPVRFKRTRDRSPCDATAVVVNLAGLYVASPTIPEPGEDLDMSLRLPDTAEIFDVRSRVVFPCSDPSAANVPHPPGFGARFLNAPPDLLTAIRKITRETATVRAEK